MQGSPLKGPTEQMTLAGEKDYPHSESLPTLPPNDFILAFSPSYELGRVQRLRDGVREERGLRVSAAW